MLIPFFRSSNYYSPILWFLRKKVQWILEWHIIITRRFIVLPALAHGCRCCIPRPVDHSRWRDSCLDGRRCPIRLRHHSLTLENVSNLQSRIHPVRPTEVPQVHHRKLDPGNRSRTHPLRICDDPDNKLICPCRARTRVHQCRRCTRLSCPHHRTGNPSPSGPKIHITDKASSETSSTTVNSRSNGGATCESPEENGDSWTIRSGLAGNRANLDGHRRQYLDTLAKLGKTPTFFPSSRRDVRERFP